MRLNRSRANYWTCTKFADWVRSTFGGIQKPKVASLEEWSKYDEEAEAKSEFIHWLTNEGFDGVQNVFYFPYDVFDMIRCFFVNRFVDKTHYLATNLEPGEYHELDTRLLHGAFESLVDFIEVEKAWMEIVFSEDKWKKYGFPLWYRFRWLRWTRKFRCQKAGMAYLAWEIKLGDESPYQAKAAKEQLALYTWWKCERPTRKDPYDEKLTLCQVTKMEEQCHQEDEEMFIRLIKVRRSLWT